MVRLAYKDEWVELWEGDFREGLDRARGEFDLCIADPPYQQTSLEWDRWVDGWPEDVAPFVSPSGSLWCWGSLRMFMDRVEEFREWKLAQDLVWKKHNGSNFHADRFRRVHEQIAQFYRGEWTGVYKAVQTTKDAVARTVRTKSRPTHTGHIDATPYESVDGGPRLMLSVRDVRSCHGRAIHPTEKPTAFTGPVIEYSCPPGGRILVPFAGSASDLEAARDLGRSAVGFEVNPEYITKAVERLRQRPLFAEAM